jgi:DNA-binding NtrC family response regulator
MISDSSVPDHARAEAHRILVIEVDGPIQRALKRLFEFEAYDVDLAKDGTSGLELFHKRGPQRSSSIRVWRTSPGEEFASKSHEVLRACLSLC